MQRNTERLCTMHLSLPPGSSRTYLSRKFHLKSHAGVQREEARRDFLEVPRSRPRRDLVRRSGDVLPAVHRLPGETH